jgi:peptidoglycan/LPS O-acetylase OafA/YrhL
VVLLAAGSRLLIVCGTLVVIALVSRAVMLAWGANPEMLYMFTFCRMDALAMGAAMAVVSRSEPAMQWIRAHSRSLLAEVLVILLVVALYSHSYSVYDTQTLLLGQTLIAAAFAALIVSVGSIPPGAVGHGLRHVLEWPWLRRVGRYSFAMYVFHLPLLAAFGGEYLIAPQIQHA